MGSFPDWPEFKADGGKLMMINYGSQMIDVPFKQRMHRMRDILLKSRNRSAMSDVVAAKLRGSH